MRKVLFIISALDEGGVSKSIVNLLNLIDRSRYDISLLVCSNSSNLLEPLLPEGLRVIRDSRISLIYAGTRGLWPLLRGGEIRCFFGSLARLALAPFSKAKAGILMARAMPPLDEEFDVIVDYNGQQQLYYMIEKLMGRRKYTFFHNDYAKWPYYYNADRIYYKDVDGIFTISEICAQSLRAFFPEEVSKINVIPNLSSPELIKKLSQENVTNLKHNGVRLISVGHLCKRKGTDKALYAASLLKKRGIDFNWIFIGKESEDINYRELVRNLGLCENISFLGLKINPYAYVSKSDIFVLCSEYEGKSIALDEAKILAKPVVVTNFSTVRDQFTDRVNASITAMTPEAIADAIEELAKDSELREKYISVLRSEEPDNSAELEKIYRILDE